MAIESEVFGSCVEGIEVSVEIENKGGWALLWVDLLGIYFGGKSGTGLTMEAGNGARYWRLFLGAFGVIEEL